MALSMTCKHCQQAVVADTEDELVARVQEHVTGHSRMHGRPHSVSREQVLTRLRRQQSKDTARSGEAGGAGLTR